MAAALAICCAITAGAGAAPLAPSPTTGLTAKKKPKKKHKKAPVKCKVGQARVTAGKRTICVKNTLPVTQLSPQGVLATTPFRLQLAGHARDRHGRRAPTLASLLGKAGPQTQRNLETAVAKGLARGRALALASALGRAHASSAARAFAAVRCAGTAEAEQIRKFLEEAPPEDKAKVEAEMAEAEKNKTFKDGEIEANADLASGALKLGIDTKAKGIHIDMSIRTCGGEGMHLDSCPTAAGVVEGHDKTELEVSFKVTEGGKLVLSQGFKSGVETTIKAQTGDDGKLDYYDIKHIYELSGTFGGGKTKFGPITVDTTYIGEAHIDMRSGSQQAPPAVVDVMTAMAGVDPAERIAAEIELAHKAQAEADKEFSAEVEKATKNLRDREAAWLKPNHCAKVVFEPASETLKLKKGQTGTFKSRTEADKGGAPPAVKWTLGAQQNATFTPGGGEANPLSTSYDVTNAGKGLLVSATVKATSKAGVAEGTWKQKTESLIQTVTGEFAGEDEREGELFKWSGTATFVRIPESPEGASILLLTSGEATITVSGTAPTGCTVSGKEQNALSPLSNFSVPGEAGPGVQYTVDTLFGGFGQMNVVFSGCPPKGEGDGPGTTSLPGEAILSGDAVGGKSSLLQTSPDGIHFDGSATGAGAAPGEVSTWSWDFTGST